MHRRWAAILVIGAALASARPASSALTFASVEILRPILSQMLGSPSVMRMDVVPDIYEGGYARVSVYAQQAAVGGMRVDEMWIRLVGVSFDPAELNRGVLRVLGVRDSGVYGKLNLQNVEAFLARQGTIQDGRTFDIRHPEMVRIGRRDLLIFTFVSDNPDVYDRWENISLSLIESIAPIEVAVA